MNWVPIDTRATQFLPKNRPYTELEASFALQVDYWRDHSATLAGYAKQWRWSRDRVRSWLADFGLQIQGQTGRQPGRLMPLIPKSVTGQLAHSDPPATGQLMFHDFGRLGDPPRQQPATNQPANPQQPDTTKDSIGKLNNTTPPTPPEEQVDGGNGQIKEYVLLAQMNGKAKDPVGLEIYLIKNGLTPYHLQQLHDWKKDAEDKRRRADEIALQAEKQKRDQEKERERIEAAWISFLALPVEAQEKWISDFRSSLPGFQRREFDPKKEKWQVSLKYWLPEKLSPQENCGEVIQ